MNCIAKKEAEQCINKLWSEIDPEIQNKLIYIINECENDYKKNECLITFGDMPFEIIGRLVAIKNEVVPRPYKISRMKLNNNLEEYYYKIIATIKEDEYKVDDYNFKNLNKFAKFLIDNLESEQLIALCEDTKNELEYRLYDLVDNNIKKGNKEYYELTWLNTYNSKQVKINIEINNNTIIFN